jgi:hypothetical protein
MSDERILKDFKRRYSLIALLPRYLPGQANETHENLIRFVGVPAEIGTGRLTKTLGIIVTPTRSVIIS